MSMSQRAIMSCAQAPGGPSLPMAGVVEIWDAAVGITEAGTGVASWLGTQAGVDMTQAVDASRPSKTTTGGFDSVLFNGASDVLTTTGLTAAVGPKTIYAVINPVSAAGTAFYFDSQTGRLANGFTGGFFVLNDGANRISNVAAATGLQLVTMQHAASIASTWKNGVAGTPVACATNRALGGTSSIGATFSNSSRYSGHVLWLGVYNANRDPAVESYLQARFGV